MYTLHACTRSSADVTGDAHCLQAGCFFRWSLRKGRHLLCAEMLEMAASSLTLTLPGCHEAVFLLVSAVAGAGGGSVATPAASVVCFISKAGDGSCEQSYYHLLLIYSQGLIPKFLKARG